MRRRSNNPRAVRRHLRGLFAGVLAALLIAVSPMAAHAENNYAEGTYGAGAYGAGEATVGDGETDPGDEDGSGPEDDSNQAPGAPNTRAENPSAVRRAFPPVDWTSLWVGIAIILGVTALLGIWLIRERRRF